MAQLGLNNGQNDRKVLNYGSIMAKMTKSAQLWLNYGSIMVN